MKNLKTVLESRIDEGKVSVTCLAQPNNVKYDLTPGWYEGGFPGIIIGKPFKYNDTKGDAAALKLVKKFGLDLGNDYDAIISDIEQDFDDDVKDLYFVYFLNNENHEVDCYVWDNGGVVALM